MSALYHVGVESSEVVSRVVLVAPGLDVEAAAAGLDDPRALGRNREYRSFRGTHDGVDVLVTSTGLGGPPLAIAVEELKRAGARMMILLDRPSLAGDDPRPVVVAGAVRSEGTTAHYAPIDFPATPDAELALGLRLRLETHRTGVLDTRDVLAPDLEAPRGVAGVDQHAAGLFVVAAATGVRAAALALASVDDLAACFEAAVGTLVAASEPALSTRS